MSIAILICHLPIAKLVVIRSWFNDGIVKSVTNIIANVCLFTLANLLLISSIAILAMDFTILLTKQWISYSEKKVV